jgi:hypothetical protein
MTNTSPTLASVKIGIRTVRTMLSTSSDDGMPIEQISRLVGRSGTSVTELVYRKQIKPVVEDGAEATDRLFPRQRPRVQPE